MEIEIEIPADNDGFILIKCALCGEYFKITAGDYNKGISDLCCPSCGLKSDSYFMFDDVMELAAVKVKNAALDVFHKEMKKWEQKSRGGLVQFKAGNKPKEQYESPLQESFEAMSVHKCKCCGQSVKMNPLLKMAGCYCSFCGELDIMKQAKNDFKKTLVYFHDIANRLMRVHWQDFDNVLRMFVAYIDDTKDISNYISSCGQPTYDVKKVVNDISESVGRKTFVAGDNEKSEAANIYCLLKYLLENNIGEIFFAKGFGFSYSRRGNYPEMVNGFNNRVSLILIRHIEKHLRKKGFDMDIDENGNSITITSNNGQVNVATDNATISAVQNNGVDIQQLKKLIDTVLKEAKSGMSNEDTKTVEESLEVIENELAKSEPKKGFLKTVMTGLQAIKGTVEFGAAVAALTQFIFPV